MIFISGPSSGRPERTAGRLGVRRPQQPDGGWMALGLRSQNQKIRLHPEGLRPTTRDDKFIIMIRKYFDQKNISSVIRRRAVIRPV